MSKKNLEQFMDEFGDYIIEPIEMIGHEVSLNYLPIRNHVIAYQMLSNDELYNQLSDSEKFDWKKQFLTQEEEKEHIQIMTNQYCDECWKWLDSQTDLTDVIKLSYTEDEMCSFMLIVMQTIWENKFNQ